jgi:tetratricopeptide (TPR) repeat protein
MVYAALDATATPAKVAITLGDERRELTVEPAAAPLVERATVAAEIARLQARMSGVTDAALRGEHLKRIIELSTGYRVLSDHTALLVLETEEDYVRFGIDRNALAGIMVATPRGVEVVNRKEAVLMAETPPPPEEKQVENAEVAVAAPPPPSAEEVAAMPAPESDDESGGTGTAMALDEGRMGRRDSDRAEGQYRMRSAPAKRSETPAYTGRMATVMDLLAAGKKDDALAEALKWRAEDAGDVLALIAVGESYEAAGDLPTAARAYGSLIDLFPARADLRRFAGERLDRLAADAGARELAFDTYRRAVEQRPDHLTGHRLLAYALVRAGKLAEAFAAIEHGLAQPYPPGRFAMGDRILREDLGLIGAAWLAAEPKQQAEITARLAKAGAELAKQASTRFVLVWETDANDVDFHIHDAKGGHAYFSDRQLPSGGELYADVTTGFGPECFAIPGTPTAAPYKLSIHYYSRGPMGYGMGKLQVLRHDGKGALTFEDRPFVVMNDDAFVDLGEVK